MNLSPKIPWSVIAHIYITGLREKVSDNKLFCILCLHSLQSKLTETEHVKSLTHQGRVESALVMTDLHPSDSGLWSCAYSLVGDALTFRKTVSKQITVHGESEFSGNKL